MTSAHAAGPTTALAPPGCLDGAHLFFTGFSEIGRYVTWIRKTLDCVPDCAPSCMRPGEALKAQPSSDCPYSNLTIDTVTSRCHKAGALRTFQSKAKSMLGLSAASLINTSITSHAAFTELRDGLCRESRYGNIGGINASCAHGEVAFNMTYRWKTFQSDIFDGDDRARIRSVARRGGPVYVILEGGGPHHFAKFREHHRVRAGKSTLFTVADDRWSWPQHWIDDYVASTKALMRQHVNDSLPANVCVLWKAMHIGPRANETRAADGDASSGGHLHHPSVVNGVHQWLNRLAISHARDLGIGVLDLSDLTMGVVPDRKLTGAHASATSEGDPYHGFPLQKMVPELLGRICAACEAARDAAASRAGARPAATTVPHRCDKRARPKQRKGKT